ncbi:Flagellum site-determining protein YlxH [Planctomycetes bacterium Pla163]|uniref:Flagellum site-determining protein YlxH n=1 Tax=Rohdeia mirabilis TaxID=2528008 RepID=A0A518D4Q6_9BACT|nr:Flagellum site-determining protein YlxH [Planctomycetes bacterium Pla163]
MELSVRTPPAPPRTGTVPLVVVTGGKGGVGKSTLALNLAADLGARGQRVLLADLDFGLGNLDVMLGVEPSATIEDFVRGAVALDACLVDVAPGVRLLPSSSGTRAMAAANGSRRDALLEALGELSSDVDVVVADTAAGIGPDVLEFTAAADYALVVTSPEPTAQADAYGLLKAFDELARERGTTAPTPELLVNRCCDLSQARRVAAHLRAVAERFLGRRPALAGWLPETRDVPRSLSLRTTLAASAGPGLATDLVALLADRIDRIVQPRRVR